MYLRVATVLLLSLANYFPADASSFTLDYDGGLSVMLLHALDSAQPNQFTFRGNMTVNLSRGANIIQEPLTSAEREGLRTLAVQDKFYRLKAIVTYTDGTTASFLTFSKACGLAKSQLTDNIWISLDSEGSVVSVSQLVHGALANCKDGLTKGDVDALEEFNTEVVLRQGDTAPIPDTNSFIQKMEREREAREKGEVKDNRGFFAKNWMYIVPVVIILLISASSNPDAQGAARQ